MVLPVTLKDLEKFHLYINEDKILRLNASHGQVQLLLFSLLLPLFDPKKSYREDIGLLLNQSYSSFISINRLKSLLVVFSTPVSFSALVFFAVFAPVICASSVPATYALVFNAPFSKFLTSITLVSWSADSERLFPLFPMVKDETESFLSSTLPSSNSVPIFFNFQYKFTDFTELDQEILGESINALSSKISPKPAGPSCKRVHKEKKTIRGKKKMRKGDNGKRSMPMPTLGHLATNKLLEKKAMTSIPFKINKTMAKSTTTAPCSCSWSFFQTYWTSVSKSKRFIKPKNKSQNKPKENTFSKNKPNYDCDCSKDVEKKWK